MGCYGIGVSRILATSIETSHDKSGIRWPDSIAPYRAIIVPIGDASETTKLMAKAEEIYSAITKEVPTFKDDIVVDDRVGENPGFRMKEAQLIGYPLMLILGKEWKKSGMIDVEVRSTRIVLLTTSH
jgi:prolyl-tRNA synthetase